MTSLTLKPNLLRADTIDLQSHDNPSAKDHSRGQYHPAYTHAGPNHAGPHHTQALRSANHDAYSEMHTSPHMDGFDHKNLGPGPQGQTYMYDEGDDDDEHGHPHDGRDGANHQGGYADDDPNDSQDEDMDDELLDKISSSPSIEDGKQPWPTRADSLHYDQSHGPRPAPSRGISFSPSQSVPGPVREESGSHQSAKTSPKRGGSGSIDFSNLPILSPTLSHGQDQNVREFTMVESSSIENIRRHLLPEDDPFLDYDMAEDPRDASFDDDQDWEDEETDEDSECSDDHQEDFSFETEPRFLDSGWGGECLREIEDIDFEFVYALHTFVATVEGQANATKGDTMVLLDDSNSYWWLVRVVKDGSIGYLPAEHIETPTERLARLNKHRNIDLSAAMLGDNPEKSKNPLKKAMRRRNAKTVNFAPPTYYEPEARDWSDEEAEDEADDASAAHLDNTAEQEQQGAQQQSQLVQQTRQIHQTNGQQRAQPATATIHHVESHDAMDEDEASSPVKSEVEAPAPLQINSQDNVQRSRNGVVRNTDSFFKDQETKKISLTPRLLRGDSDVTGPVEQEVKQQPSVDTFDKIVADEKPKDGKKKEKKGMLSGLFKRTKSGKSGKNEADETDRISEDSGRPPQSKDSMDSETTPERKPSKLQKTPPTVSSPKASPTDTRAPQRDFAPTNVQQQAPTVSQRNQIVPPQQHQPPQELSAEPQAQQPSRFPSLQEKRSVGAKITDALRSKNSGQDMGDPTVKPVYSKRAKERFAIDESDSENDSTPTAQSSVLHRSISPLENDGANDQRPVSHMRVSPVEDRDQTKPGTHAPLPEPEPIERSGHSEQMPVEPTPASPSDQTASTSKQSPSIPAHTPSTSRSTPTWSDSSLRSYMDNDQDIRDLLVIVHDKTNITPVGPEHPLMNGLFASERTKLADMQSQLDSMLLSWLSKKNQPTAVKI